MTPPPATTDTAVLRRIAFAAGAGTVVEWFDFAVYGFFATALGTAFFPSGDKVAGLLQTFAVFAVSFALRPVGGALFGSLGDRIGRKRVLAITVLLMSGATAVVGVLPAYANAGVLAPVLLTLARCVQGLCAGGEYAGACTYLVEHCPPEQRARYASLLPAATFAAFGLAALLSFVLSAVMSTEVMSEWGWRAAFLLAAPMGGAGFYIRRSLRESPAFEQVAAGGTKRPKLLHTLRAQRKPMLRLGGFISLTAVSFYMFSTYMTTFFRSVVGMSENTVFLSNVIALFAATAMAPFFGRFCDAVGRRATMIVAAVSLGVLTVPAYLVGGIGNFGTALVGQLLLAVGAVAANVVTAVLLSEVFPTAVRYTSSAVTYNVSYAVFGGTVPFVATLLVSLTGSHLAPAVYVSVIAAGALVAALALPETARLPLLDTAPDDPTTEPEPVDGRT